MKLVVAKTNLGKLREIRSILAGAPVELVGLEAFPQIPEPEETGRTFAENARLKALYYANATGLPSVADDSGLEIAELGNAPGVHSARWYGTDYNVKFATIYERLQERGVATSAARFVCHVALAEPGRIVHETTGTIEGLIAPTPKGTNGFGYDPILVVEGDRRHSAELTPEEKNAISHRGKAFRAMVPHLRELLG